MPTKIKSMWSKNLLLYIPGIIILGFGVFTLHLSHGLSQHHHDQKRERSHDLSQSEHALEAKIHQKEFMLNVSAIAMLLSGLIILLIIGKQLQKFSTVESEKEKHFLIQERSLAALEASPDGVAIIDTIGILSYSNVSLLSMLGIKQENHSDYIDKSWNNLFKDVVNEIVYVEIISFVEKADNSNDKLSVIIRVEGEKEKIVRISATGLKDKGCILTVHDITEEKQVQSEKEELQDQFYQSQKMEAIGRLTGGVAHDFNNILAAINGYAEFLVDDLEEGSSTHGFASNILQAGLRARRLVEHMLAFSRRKEGSHEIIDLTFSMQDAFTMLQVSLPKTIKVEQHINLESARVRGNAGQITQVLMNLCVNANDAMEEDRGQLTLTIEEAKFKSFPVPKLFCDELPNPKETAAVSFKEINAGRTILSLGTLAKNQKYYCLSISDTGCGMSRVIMEHIFEPFFTTKPVNKGTGLGLSMVHGTVTAHQGCMIIDSTLGVGTTFHLYFPAELSNMAEMTSERKEEDGAHDNLLILLVEDQGDVREMIMDMLKRMGIEAESACDGDEAMAILRESPDMFDLVITDYNMPKVTGLELAQHAGIEFPNLPFIVLSGYSQEKVSELIKGQKNVFATLKKPIGKNTLCQKIHSIVDEKRKENA